MGDSVHELDIREALKEFGIQENVLPLALSLAHNAPPHLSHNSLKAIEKEFLSQTREGSRETARRDELGVAVSRQDRVVAMARTTNGDHVPVTLKTLHTAVKAGALPAEFDCLHPFKQAKDFDNTGKLINYQHQYTLDDTGGGVPVGVAYRRVTTGLGRGYVSARDDRDFIISRNAGVNSEINIAARRVVLAVERSQHCRVLRLDTDFMLDDQDNLWLAGATSCTVAFRSAIPSQSVPSLTGAGNEGALVGSSRGGDTGTDRKDCLLATEARNRKREADDASGVVNDAHFFRLLRDIGYQLPTKSRSGSGHRRRPRERCTPGGLTKTVSGARDPTSSMAVSTTSRSLPLHQYSAVLMRGGSLNSAPSEGAWECIAKNGEGFRVSDSHSNDVEQAEKTSSSFSEGSPAEFDLTIGKLDQPATNRIYGSTQVGKVSFLDMQHRRTSKHKSLLTASGAGDTVYQSRMNML